MLLALGCLTVLGVTFTAGIFAGRQWTQVLPSIGARPGHDPRRDTKVGERKPPAPAPVLTFYQELTAPLTAPPPRPKPTKPVEPAAKPAQVAVKSAEAPKATPVSGPAPADRQAVQKIGETDGATTDVARPPTANSDHAAPSPAIQPAPVTSNRYTVQVGAFKTREQAEAFRTRLATAGHDAYVADLEGTAGARFRVRVGTFTSRDDARHVAERLAAERFATYVTLR